MQEYSEIALTPDTAHYLCPCEPDRELAAPIFYGEYFVYFVHCDSKKVSLGKLSYPRLE